MSQITGYIVLSINAVILIAIGIFARKTQITSAEDYMVAGRRVKWPLISGSIVVTWAWASTVLAAGEAAYNYGWPAIWIYPISGLSLALAAPLFAKVKRYLPKGTTFIEYARLRFGDRVHKLLLVVAIYVHLILLMYLGTGLGWGIGPLFDISYGQAVVISGVIIIIFTVLGGLWSSILTDYFQYIVMWVVLAIAFIYGVFHVGGMDGLFNNLSNIGMQKGYAVYTQDSFINFFLVYLFGWLTYASADQTMWQRAYAIENPKDTFKTFIIAWVSWSLLPMLAGLMGLIGLSLGIETTAGSDILANLISKISPNWVLIAWAFLVFNAIASSYGSVLVAISSIITTDIYKKYISKNHNISDSKMLKLNNILVIVIGVFGILISLMPNSVLSIGIYLCGFLIISGTPIYLSYFINYLNKNAVFWGTLTAFIIALVLSTAVNFGWITKIGNFSIQIWHVYALTLITEVLIIVIGTILTPGKKVSFEELAEMQSSELNLSK